MGVRGGGMTRPGSVTSITAATGAGFAATVPGAGLSFAAVSLILSFLEEASFVPPLAQRIKARNHHRPLDLFSRASFLLRSTPWAREEEARMSSLAYHPMTLHHPEPLTFSPR